jgi:hypothetical protein
MEKSEPTIRLMTDDSYSKVPKRRYDDYRTVNRDWKS